MKQAASSFINQKTQLFNIDKLYCNVRVCVINSEFQYVLSVLYRRQDLQIQEQDQRMSDKRCLYFTGQRTVIPIMQHNVVQLCEIMDPYNRQQNNVEVLEMNVIQLED